MGEHPSLASHRLFLSTDGSQLLLHGTISCGMLGCLLGAEAAEDMNKKGVSGALFKVREGALGWEPSTLNLERWQEPGLG
jgi:hypothetical protein